MSIETRKDDALRELDLLRQVILAVREDPAATLDMRNWVRLVGDEPDNDRSVDYSMVNNGYGTSLWDGEHTCNTAACLGGWTFICPGAKNASDKTPSELSHRISNTVQKAISFSDYKMWGSWQVFDQLFNGAIGDYKSERQTYTVLLNNIKKLEKQVNAA